MFNDEIGEDGEGTINDVGEIEGVGEREGVDVGNIILKFSVFISE